MNGDKTVLLRNAGVALTETVAAELMARGARVLLADMTPDDGQRLVSQLSSRQLAGQAECMAGNSAAIFAALGERPLDAVIHLYLPDADTSEADVRQYAARLRTRMAAAQSYMQSLNSPGIVVNQFLMPTLFVDHPLGDAMVLARSELDALCRLACIRYGSAGIRTLGLMIGLLDIASLRALLTPDVQAATTPLGRWITPLEVAKTLTFLCLDSGYMSGQSLVLDGGMTGGCNGV